MIFFCYTNEKVDESFLKRIKVKESFNDIPSFVISLSRISRKISVNIILNEEHWRKEYHLPTPVWWNSSTLSRLLSTLNSIPSTSEVELRSTGWELVYTHEIFTLGHKIKILFLLPPPPGLPWIQINSCHYPFPSVEFPCNILLQSFLKSVDGIVKFKVKVNPLLITDRYKIEVVCQ